MTLRNWRRLKGVHCAPQFRRLLLVGERPGLIHEQSNRHAGRRCAALFHSDPESDAVEVRVGDGDFGDVREGVRARHGSEGPDGGRLG